MLAQQGTQIRRTGHALYTDLVSSQLDTETIDKQLQWTERDFTMKQELTCQLEKYGSGLIMKVEQVE